MNKDDKTNFIIIILTVTCIFLTICVIGTKLSINDKNAYINGLKSDRAICNGQLDVLKHDYKKISDELEKIKGDIDG